ncbi:hypothetical protein Salat_0483400 [Sesamum alatum]|uniref:Uncharacterized protein n=1 Tax=Sesamum alatum TaxID=300844 RepID=A0AAE2D0T0_9LAMI|nr:hypothetical protein Salat_0483400 [Sesamum alatum]
MKHIRHKISIALRCLTLKSSHASTQHLEDFQSKYVSLPNGRVSSRPSTTSLELDAAARGRGARVGRTSIRSQLEALPRVGHVHTRLRQRLNSRSSRSRQCLDLERCGRCLAQAGAEPPSQRKAAATLALGSVLAGTDWRGRGSASAWTCAVVAQRSRESRQCLGLKRHGCEPSHSAKQQRGANPRSMFPA